MKKNLYEILGVSAAASVADIELAYQQRCAADDLDANQLVILREAWHVLANVEKRRAYDANLANASTTLQAMPMDEPSSSNGGWMKIAVVVLLVVAAAGWWHAWKAPEGSAKPSVAASGLPATPGPAAEAPAGNPPIAIADHDLSSEELFARVANSVALVMVSDNEGNLLGSGSGVVIGDGVVVTNCHVALYGPHLKAQIAGQAYEATVGIADQTYDLCRLEVAGLHAPAVTFDRVSALRTGQKVYAIGAPLGLDLTISNGIISSLRPGPNGTLIQTTAAISHGSSGGGLFAADGGLIGITTFMYGDGQNLNFALPVDWISSMSTRGPSGESPIAVRTPQTAAGSEFAQTQKVIGSWHCYAPVGGDGLDLTFSEDGKLLIQLSNGKVGYTNYRFINGSLIIAGNETMTLSAQEVTATSLILNAGQGYRLVCQRK